MNCMEHIAGMHMIKIHMIEIHIMNLIVEVCKRFITKRTTSRMFIIDLKKHYTGRFLGKEKSYTSD